MGACSVSVIDQTLSKVFHWLGVIIGKHPSYFIVLPVFVALLLGTGMQRLVYVDDPEYLFSPVNGKAKSERLVIENLFPMNYTTRFHPSRFVRPGRFARLFIQAQDGGSLLRPQIFEELVFLDQLVHNISIPWDSDEEYRYSDLCAAWEGSCYENDVLDLAPIMPQIESKNISLNWPVYLTPNTFKTLGFPFIFGGFQINHNRSTIDSVKAIQLNYFLAVNTRKQDVRGELWEQKLLDTLDSFEGHWRHLKIARFTVRTLAQELEKNTFSVLPYFSLTAIWMTLFMIFTCMMLDWVKAKPWLGIIGVISACLGSFAAFGLVCYCGVEFIGINMAAPFLMLGIGIDDTFVMLAAWRRTSPHKSVPERMGETYSEAAVSITITSITDMLSFWVGVITPFPCVQIFSIYSGAAVVATYLWHIFFFGGAIALSGYHEKENRHSLLCCYKATPKSKLKGHGSIFYKLWCTGGIDPNDPFNPLDNPDNGIMVFFRDYWAKFINNSLFKLLVLGGFIGYLAISCYGITKTKEGLERRKLSRYDSYVATFFDVEDQFFREYPYRIQVVITGELDYSNKTTQSKVESMMKDFENSKYCTGEFTESWLRNFLTFVNRSQDIFNWDIGNEQKFVTTLTEEYVTPKSFYWDDIRLDENRTKILAARFIIQSGHIRDSNEERDMADGLREIARRHESSLNCSVTVFHPLFVFFDQFLLIRQTSINCVAIAALVMMGVSLIFIPSPICSLWVAFSIVSIEAGVVGFMALWNVNLDAISMMNLIMCIGFSVDFSAHISYAYITAAEPGGKGDTPEERVRACLYSLGLPIVQGAVSTILGVVALLLAPSYIFITFFKVITLVIVIAAVHGLVLLPVLLSLFGPGAGSKFCGKGGSTMADVGDGGGMMGMGIGRKGRSEKVVPCSFIVKGEEPKIGKEGDHKESRWMSTILVQGYPQRDSELLEVKGSAGTVFGGVGVAIPRAKVNKGGRRFRRAGVVALEEPAARNYVGVERDLGLGTSGGEDESTSECNSSQVLSSDEEGAQGRRGGAGGPNENRVVHQQQPRRGSKVKGINNLKKK